MGMYSEVRVETSLKKRLESHFRCSRCGTEADAVAVGWGSGEGLSPFGIDDDGAGQRARGTAETNALEEARTALAVVPCPRCGERDHAAVKAYKRTTIVGVIRVLGLGGLAGAGLSALMDFARTPAIICGVISVLGAALIYKSRGQRFDDAVKEVEFRIRDPYRQQGFGGSNEPRP
jgi:ribosomal protein L37E